MVAVSLSATLSHDWSSFSRYKPPAMPILNHIKHVLLRFMVKLLFLPPRLRAFCDLACIIWQVIIGLVLSLVVATPSPDDVVPEEPPAGQLLQQNWVDCVEDYRGQEGKIKACLAKYTLTEHGDASGSGGGQVSLPTLT